MPTHLRIFHAHDFIKVTPEGKLDFEESRKLLIEVASAMPALVKHAIILDTRKAESELSVADLFNLASQLTDYCQAFSQKTAVLCPLERFDKAGFFALCAQNRGLQFKAFTSFEDAIDWLS